MTLRTGVMHRQRYRKYIRYKLGDLLKNICCLLFGLLIEWYGGYATESECFLSLGALAFSIGLWLFMSVGEIHGIIHFTACWIDTGDEHHMVIFI